MDNTFYDKTMEYNQKFKEYEEGGDYENALKVLNEEIVFVNGFFLNEKNPVDRTYYDHYKRDLMVLRRIFELAIKFDPIKNDMNKRLNEFADKLQKLENRLDLWEKDR